MKGVHAATHFALSSDELDVLYDTADLTGQPALRVGDHLFRGAEIRAVEGELGTQLTVTLESIPDLRVRTFTLFVPLVQVEQGGTAEINVLGVITTTHSTLAGPPLGQEKTYEPLDLAGTAQVTHS
ncbi:MAG: hypothetical protein H6739_39450 [Alphaproteobacteria bacterium]|nr:hypothetical protein [Alphaproteobacteria bacterium]